MADTSIIRDKEGNPILVRDDAINGSAPQPEPVPAPEPLQVSVKPDDVSWDEWERRQAAISSLAREFDEVDRGDVREFLGGKLSRDLDDNEIDQLIHDISAHRLSDLTDIFDNQLRSTVDQMKRGRRTVRVAAPRGWTKRAFNQLDSKNIEQLCARLISRGHDSKTIKDKVVSRVADEHTRDTITARLDGNELKVES